MCRLKAMVQNKMCTNWNAVVVLSILSSVTITSNVAGCNNNEIEITLNNTISSGNLSSPNYPDWIPANLSCIWILTCPPGRLIKLYLNKVMFNATSKNHSYLEIRDGDKASSPLIVNITKQLNYTVPVIYSSGQKLSLHLKEGGLGETTGSIRFLISYSYMKPGKTCSASNSEDENNNILLTPPFLLTIGTDLPSEVDCTWKIAPSKRGVLMNLTLNMKKTLVCSTGSTRVYMYDGPYGPASKLKHDLCKEPGEVPSFTSDVGLSLQLKSSNFSSILEMQASEDDCIYLLGIYYYTKTRIEGQPLSRTQCQRKFSNPSGALALKIAFIHLPPGCENNNLQFFEIHKQTNKSILRAKFCHPSPVIANIIIYSGEVLIMSKIQTPTNYLDGFHVHIFPHEILESIDRPYCSEQNSPERNANITQTSRKGYVSSHLQTAFGSSYPPGMFCRWIIIPTNVTDKEQIEIRFLRFDFSKGYGKDCAQDHVQLDFGNGSVQRYCKATGKPPSVIYSGDAKSMIVTFVSTPLYTGNGGFSFNYDVFPVVSSPPPPPGKRLSWAVIGVLIGAGCILVACVAFGIYRWKTKHQDMQPLDKNSHPMQ